jgi:xanthosine utilization system XapX-like protein
MGKIIIAFVAGIVVGIVLAKYVLPMVGLAV